VALNHAPKERIKDEEMGATSFSQATFSHKALSPGCTAAAAFRKVNLNFFH